ncbi:MAG: translation initiation factor IF-2 [bacterium]
MNPEPTLEKKSIEIPNAIVIKDLAKLFDLPVTRVIGELMKNGVMSSMNERIDYETAAIIAEELGFSAVLKESDEGDRQHTISETLQTLLNKDDAAQLIVRPPVVVVMGHVDHGKTKLLDAIRQTNVVAGESGGITQHIGAYQVKKKEHLITFIDTPGHEAFTAMRSRGAHVADIAILVVAADDGIMPQTKEAIRIIRQAKLPLIVAINKIDKPGADPEKVKRQLAEENLLAEDWGGKIVTAPVSALTGKGIDELLETILLLAQVEEEHLKADPTRAAVGSVIEAHLDKGEGPVATVIVRTGTLRRGDHIRIGDMVGKVKALRDWQGNPLDAALPSQPAKILGLHHAPEVGDVVSAIDASEAKKVRRRQKVRTERVATDVVYQRKNKNEQQEVQQPIVRTTLNIVLRCDNLGSQEAILESLQKYEATPVRVEIVAKGLGSITEADVQRANTAKALLLGFHVVPTPRASEVAKSKQCTIQTYTVIYDLLSDIHDELEKLLPVEVIETTLGRLKILAVFRREKQSMIAGGKVLDGLMRTKARARVLRGDVVIGTGVLQDTQVDKRHVDEVKQGSECGIRYIGDPVIDVGDIVEAYEVEERRVVLDESKK